MTMTKKEAKQWVRIKCNCGRMLTCRPNRNGVVLCPACKSAHTPQEFAVPTPRREIMHDFTGR